MHSDPIIGSYRLEERIDEGEFAAVYRVQHVVLGSRHALKILHDGQDPPIVRALHQAARLQAAVVHPNLVRVTDAGTDDGRPWLVMDWIDGRSLEDWLERGGAFSIDRAVPLFRAIVRGVHALHAEHIVHRDLKPANVLVGKVRGRHVPHLNDLGLAKKLDPTQPPRPSGLSVEYRTLGTPGYMAPEQVLTVGEVDRRADLWSLGVLLYELLTDTLPFDDDDPLEAQRAVLLGRYTPLTELRPDLPPAVDEVVRALLVPDADRRLGSTGELLQRLDQL